MPFIGQGFSVWSRRSHRNAAPRHFTIRASLQSGPHIHVRAFVACDSPCPRSTSASQARGPDSPSGSRAKTRFDSVATSVSQFRSNHASPTTSPLGDLFILGAPAPSRASRRLPSPFHSFLIVSLRHRSCQLQTDFLITGFDVRNVPVDPTPSDRPICRAYQFVGVIPRDEIQRRVFVLSNHKALARNLCS